jgi:hypothetical protein
MRYLAILLVGCCAVPAQAVVVVYESFSGNTAGQPILGQTADTGQTWVTASTSPNPSVINVASGSLSVPAPLQPAMGNSAEIDGIGNGAGKSVRLPFGQTFSDPGSTVYYSFPLRIDALTGSTNVVGGFFIALNSDSAASTANPTAAAARVQSRIDPTDGTKYNLGIFRNVNAASAATSWSGPLTVGETLFVVASYEIVSGTQNDIARMWINPGSLGAASPPPATLTDGTTGTGLDIGIASIILRQSPAPHLTLDELRVGTDWASVTVPETSSFLLVGGALLLAGKKTVKSLVNRIVPWS